MRLMRDPEAPAGRRRSLRSRTTTALSAIALILGSLALGLGIAGPASATPAATAASTFPTTKADCKHGGWAGFSGVDFRNQGQCISWVQHAIVHEDCLPGALADFAETGPT